MITVDYFLYSDSKLMVLSDFYSLFCEYAAYFTYG